MRNKLGLEGLGLYYLHLLRDHRGIEDGTRRVTRQHYDPLVLFDLRKHVPEKGEGQIDLFQHFGSRKHPGYLFIGAFPRLPQFSLYILVLQPHHRSHFETANGGHPALVGIPPAEVLAEVGQLGLGRCQFRQVLNDLIVIAGSLIDLAVPLLDEAKVRAHAFGVDCAGEILGLTGVDSLREFALLVGVDVRAALVQLLEDYLELLL
jgi:hypothetical protein